MIGVMNERFRPLSRSNKRLIPDRVKHRSALRYIVRKSDYVNAHNSFLSMIRKSA